MTVYGNGAGTGVCAATVKTGFRGRNAAGKNISAIRMIATTITTVYACERSCIRRFVKSGASPWRETADGSCGVPRLVAFPRRIASAFAVEMLWLRLYRAAG